ncbi:MAG: hypothetical protein U0441_07910 [Polyangiaceae bacterium]
MIARVPIACIAGAALSLVAARAQAEPPPGCPCARPDGTPHDAPDPCAKEAPSAPSAAPPSEPRCPCRDKESPGDAPCNYRIRNWPDSPCDPWRLHVYFTSSVGTHARRDADVGASSALVDVGVGLDVPFHLGTEPFRFDAELAFGWVDGVSTGALVERSTGGFFAAIRPMFGHDFTRDFFVRAGFELTMSWPHATWTPGFRGLLDLGGRLSPSIGSVTFPLELGTRLALGGDGMQTSSADKQESGLAFSYGGSVFVRWFVR